MSWLFFHPHQGLWNARLLGILQRVIPVQPVYIGIVGIIVLLDTAILWMRVFGRRMGQFGPASLVARTRLPAGIPVLYFDLGTHRNARELSWMVDEVLPRLCSSFQAYGFEPCHEFYEQARARLADRGNVQLVNCALCYGLPTPARLRLYRPPGHGLTSSLYRPQYGEYEEVDALRFSDWVRSSGLHLENSVCLLRMNIEGAESDVIQDLVDHGLASYIDGYYGMWDDVGKIDRQRDEDLRALLASAHISKLTFNGRDMRVGFRRKCIEYDVHTSAQVGLRRMRRAQKFRN